MRSTKKLRKHAISNRKAGVPEHAHEWDAVMFRFRGANSPASIDFTFPTRDGRSGHHRIRPSLLRDTKRILADFKDRLCSFPSGMDANDNSRAQFIRDLVPSGSPNVLVVPSKPGFIDPDHFATSHEIISADGGVVPIPQAPGEIDVIPATCGTRAGSKEVLELATHSNYLAFCIGVALAAPLSTYLRLHRDGDSGHLGLTETAVFNLSGTSSSGKSTAALAAFSFIGSPERCGNANFSERGISERAAQSNDMLLALDDTEKNVDGLMQALRLLTHVIPGGRSKHISKGADQSRFPELRWSTLVLSSSPEPLLNIGREAGWEMSRGDHARLYNIHVPSPEHGGIFDRIKGRSKERAKARDDSSIFVRR